MRMLEVLILTVLCVSLVRCLLPPAVRPFWLAWLPALAVLLIGWHLVVERPRWQMVPAYGLALLLVLLSLSQLAARGPAPAATLTARPGAVVAAVLGLLSLTLTVALPALVPVFRLPQPTGPYAVGTTSFSLVDPSRPELFTPEQDDRRELLVQAWYPADPPPGARPVPYLENLPAVHQALAHVGRVLHLPVPAFVVDHLALVQTHSYRDAPVSPAERAYPVLIFSHGYLAWGTQNTAQMEELASHGYVLFSVSHPYESVLTIFPDGRFIPVDPQALRGFLQQSHIRDWEASLNTWVQDELCLLDELERLNAGAREGLFAGRLDLARLGLFGHSFGGSTAIRVCALDARCTAGISLDGGELQSPYLPRQPFLHMRRQGGLRGLEAAGALPGPVYLAVVRGTRHMDFGDFTLFSPLLRLSKAPLIGTGPIGGRRMVRLLNVYALGFFDRYLRGAEIPLLDGPTPAFPEVDLQRLAP